MALTYIKSIPTVPRVNYHSPPWVPEVLPAWQSLKLTNVMTYEEDDVRLFQHVILAGTFNNLGASKNTSQFN